MLPLEKASEELASGKSLRMVAQELGVCHSTLSRQLRMAGYKVPTKSESAKNTWKNHVHPQLGKKESFARVMAEKCRNKPEAKCKKSMTASQKSEDSVLRKMPMAMSSNTDPSIPTQTRADMFCNTALFMRSISAEYLSRRKSSIISTE